MTTRRSFLAALMAASAVPRIGWAAAGSPAWLAAAQDPDGAFALYGLRPDGSAAFRVPLPARGHAGAGHPTQALAVAFARRPGHYALVIDCITGEVRTRLDAAEGRQFNGHGVFLDGGKRLVTSEQRAEDSQGILGFWDTATWTRTGEASTGGIGPHDLRLMADATTLIVANGGIATDPTDRTKLNIPDMAPNLAYLDTHGALLETVALAPDLHQASIRHLALRPDGLTAFAMQWEGDPERVVPLMGLHRRGAAPMLATTPEDEAPLMQGYAGSIAWNAAGTEVAITSPRGGRVQRFDEGGRFAGAFARADVCGLAPAPGGLLASDGQGALIALAEGKPRLLARHKVAWDNHIVAL